MMPSVPQITQMFQSVAPTMAGALLSSLWQGLLLAGGVAALLRLARGVSPALRSALWAAVLLLLVLLPVLTVITHSGSGAAAGEPGLHVASFWSTALVAIWATLSIFRAVQLGWQGHKLLGLAARAVPVAVEGELARSLQGPRRAVLCVSAEVNRPGVAGFFRPRILLPMGLLQTLSAVELQQVVLHEMEHLRRGDDWLNLLQQISLILLPLQPALLWVDRELCRERELACDDGVLAATQSRKDYAACLVKLAEESLTRKGIALALSALGTRARESELVGRVRRILAGPERSNGGYRTHATVTLLASATLVCAGLLLQSPEWIHFDGNSLSAATATEKMEAASAGPDAPLAASWSGRMRLAAATGTARPVLTRATLMQSAATPDLLANAVARPLSGDAQDLSRRPPLTARRLRGAELLSRAHRPARKPALTLMHAHPQLLQTRAALDDLPAKSRSALFAPRTEAAARTRIVAAPDSMSGHLVVTEFEISQPVYAAVAVAGGWLVLQL